jgi:hypothetical protein
VAPGESQWIGLTVRGGCQRGETNCCGLRCEAMTRNSVCSMMLTVDARRYQRAVQKMQDHRLLFVVIFVACLFVFLLLLGPQLWHRWISELT